MNTLPDINTIKSCISKYSLIGWLENISPVKEGKFHNILYHIGTNKGHFVLKVLTTHHYESTESRYEYITSVMDKISNLGIKVPMPIRNDNHLLLTPCGRYKAVLSEYIDGQLFQRHNLQHQASAGNFLGMFHKATFDCRPRGTCWLRELDSYFILNKSLEDLLPLTPEAYVIREHFEELMERSIKIHNEFRACNYSHLPRTVIHSEYVVKHLKMANGHVSGLLDFEYTRRDARGLDVALALEDFPCTRREGRDFNYDGIRAFITAYNSCGMPLQQSEITSFPTLLKAWYLACITYWVEYVIRTKNKIILFGIDMRDRITENFGDIDWWDIHGDEFVARVIDEVK